MLFLKILGTIFKIIGILLLCILLLLLFILLVLLFVPIRYRAKLVRDGDELLVQGEVSYLLRLIRLPVSFQDKSLHIRLSVLGVTLFSNEGGKKGRRRKKKGMEDAKEEGESDSAKTTEENVEAQTEGNGEEENTKEENARQGNTEEQTKPLDVQAEESTEKIKEEENVEDAQTTQEDGRAEPQDIPDGLFGSIWRLIHSFKQLVRKIKTFFEKLAGICQNIRAKIFSTRMKISDIMGKAKLVLEFLRDEENKNGIKYAGKSIFRLLKHVFPYKIEGDIAFATGDPYSMGRALSILGMLYPLYARTLSLSADFTADHFRLDGCVQVKGRIRFATVLWIAWKLWSKGRLKLLLSRAKELKQKLTASAL